MCPGLRLSAGVRDSRITQERLVAYAALRLSTHIASATFNYQQLEFDQQVGRLARRASNSQSYFTCTQRPVNDFEGATRESSKFRGFMSPLTNKKKAGRRYFSRPETDHSSARIYWHNRESAGNGGLPG